QTKSKAQSSLPKRRPYTLSSIFEYCEGHYEDEEVFEADIFFCGKLIPCLMPSL
ncbi:DUF4055 domain-containing protein, partial [Sesbania bispinosa]